MMTCMPRPEIADVQAALARIEPFVHRTPVARCKAIDAWSNRDVHLKCENLQKVGAFKARGAMNAVLLLDDDAAARGVVTHSSGNHAQALAWAARERRIAAHIVMPTNAPPSSGGRSRDTGASCTTANRTSNRDWPAVRRSPPRPVAP